MSELPETRESLLMQLRDRSDVAAWERFVGIYRPAVYRFARRCGLQHADAEDLAQQVVTAVSTAVGDWEKDPRRGTFRGWLLKIARNKAINIATRTNRISGRGGTSFLRKVDQEPGGESEVQQLIDDEHRRAVFRWAAEEVRQEFEESTWRAFWLTAIGERTVEEAAAELGKTIGSVYAARSRVLRRLREKVREFEAE